LLSSSSISKTRRTSESPSFVCEIPLKVTCAQEKALLTRFEAARQVYNACLGEARRRLDLMRQSKPYGRARSLSLDDLQRKALLAEARGRYGFKDADLQHYAVVLRHSWIGHHLDVHTTQRLATRAFMAVERMLYGQARKVRFKGKNQMDTVESKSNLAGIRWRENHVEWKGLVLPGIIDPGDAVVSYALSCRVKYVRLVRRKIRGKNRFSAQLVSEGYPYQKAGHNLGKGIVGLDIGPSTVAVVGEEKAFLTQFCAELESKEREIRRLKRRLDRQRRANNPENYEPDGTIKKGPKTWHHSRRYQKTREELAEIERKRASQRKTLQGRLVNGILEFGDTFLMEKLSYKALQRTFGKSVGFRAPGRFVSELRRKAGSAGGKVIEFPTVSTKLSQICHCGRVHKKRLSERWHRCECRAFAQRDLYSAFLARFVSEEANLLHAGQAKEAWPGAEPLLRAAWQRAVENQPASGRIPSSFGYTRSRSGSSAEGKTTEAKARDGVAYLQGDGESPGEAKAFLLRTPWL